MKINYLKYLLTALLLLCTSVTNANDFEVNGIYYYITDSTNKNVAVSINTDSEYTGDVIIPETVTYNNVTYSVKSIGNYAFFCCTGLKSVTIPNSVTSIGGYAFEGCTGLTSVTIGNSVTSFDYSMFDTCTGLASIVVENGNSVYDSRNNCNAIIETATNALIVGCKNTVIPNSVTSIGWGAFSNCTGLTSITIPNSVTSIGAGAFEYCFGLENIVVENGNSVYDSRNNCNAIIETATNALFAGCKNTVIPNSVTSIADRAFSNCTGLESITIPNSITSIGGYAFYGCTGLASIVVENGNSVYDSRNNCNAIIETATNALIAGCKNTVIPNSVTSIGKYVFSGCTGLTSIEIPNSVTSIGGYAFEGCTGLTSLEIPNSVTSIGDDAFSDCTGLTSIEIPNSVVSLGDEAFENCLNVETLYIGNSVESIGWGAFKNCEKIKEIKIGLEKPISCPVPFADVIYDSAILYVPIGTKSLYQEVDPWYLFLDIKEMDFTGIEDVLAEVVDERKGENGNVKGIYDLIGRKIDVPTKGIYIINGKKILVK